MTLTATAPYLRVVLSRPLPNVDVPDQVPRDIRSYGRFGYTTTGEFFLSSERSSHPMNTRDGGYFGVSRDFKTLFLSPRGASIGFQSFASDVTIRRVCNRLGLKNIYRFFKIQERTTDVATLWARRASDRAKFFVEA